jgi:hypothetical protein
MADDQRVYSDEEFARILRSATEMANRAVPPSVAATGLTLADMKSAAAQAGLDPALVERAARELVVPTSASLVERLIGGPVQHQRTAHFDIAFDEQRAARLLSAVRINADYHSTDPGHSSALGMMWRAAGAGDVLSVAARPVARETAVTAIVDRRGTFVLTGVVTSLALFLAVLFAVFALYPESPTQGVSGLVVGVGGILALARAFWASSTRQVQEKLSEVVEVISETLRHPAD